MILLLLLFSALVAFLLSYLLEIDSFDRLKIVVGSLLSGEHWSVAIFQPDEQSHEHGGTLVAQVLKRHNVDSILTLIGGHISPILVACEKIGIRVVDVRNEVTAVFAADAIARLKQGFGVACVTAGPGLTNTITAVKNAQMAESAVLLFGGAAASLLKGRGSLQDIDQMSLFKPICKLCISIKRVRDIPKLLNMAIQTAQSDTPGPVFVEFPIDTLYPYKFVLKEAGINPNPKGVKQRIVQNYIRFSIAKLFGRAFEQQNEEELKPLPVHTPQPSSQEVDQISDAVIKAQRPLLLIGSQALQAPVKAGVLAQTVKELGIPCYLGGMARGLMGQDGAGIQMKQKRRDALKDADLVILAGAVVDFRLSYGRVLSRNSTIVAINRSKRQLFLNSDMFWKPSVAVQADVATTLVKINERLKFRQYKGAPSTWLTILTNRETEVDAKNAKLGLEKPDEHLNPVQVCMALEKAFPDDAILVADGGDFVGTAAYTVRPRGPLSWLDPGAFGTLGVGAGFAIGAKLAFPDRPVIIIYGDGSLGYSLIEFDTYKRHNMPVIAVVGNDACWMQIAREQVPYFKTAVACILQYTAYEKMVEPLGAAGLKLDAEDADTLESKFKQIFELSIKEQKSALVNVFIGKSKFREGSISM